LTDADYKDAAVYLYTSLYGSASQQSISNYKDFKILLDKAGLGAYNGGAGVEMLSGNLDNIISKIGIINTNYGRWTIATNTDFSTGTYSNCYNNTGTVEISSSVYKWDTTAEFQGAGYSVNATSATEDEIKLLKNSGGLTLGTISSAYVSHDGVGQSQLQSVGGLVASLGFSFDTLDNTGVGVAFLSKYRGWVADYSIPTSNIKKLQVSFIVTNYAGFTHSFIALNSNMLRMWNTSDTNYDWNIGYFTNEPSTKRIIDFEVPTAYYNVAPYKNVNKIQWIVSPAIDYAGILLYELKYWTENTATYYCSSGSYTSPNFTSAGATGQYQNLIVSDNLSHTESTSSDTIKYYAGNDASCPVYLGLSSGSYTTFPITGLDNTAAFYWKAELYTSSITATPTINSVSLQYATTGYATYKSKVFNVGKKITSWDSFLASYEGTALFRVRASSKTYNLDIATLPESGANQWTYITSGSDLSTVITSTNNAFIQIEAQLHTKNTKIESLTATWFEGGEGSGGEQDVASINYRDRYYLAYSTWASYNTDVLVFDKNGRFTRYDWNVAGFTEFNNKLYFLSSTDNKIYQAFTGTDDAGTPYEMLWRSPDYDCGLKDVVKEFYHIYATGKKQTGSFAYVDTYIDFATTPTKSIYWDLSRDSNYKFQLDDKTYGKNMAIVVRSTATTCEIQNINIFYKTKTLGTEPER
jgi:hypothetical protein